MTNNREDSKCYLEKAKVDAYKIPTQEKETDATLAWDNTILVLVSLSSNNLTGIGYTYANPATAYMIAQFLLPLIKDENVLDNTFIWNKMLRKTRNLGRPGITSMAIADVDNALWDLKAKLLKLPLCKLLGQAKKEVQVYASGGFTSLLCKSLEHF